MKRRKTREKLVGETGKIVSKKPKGAKLLVSKDTAKIWPVFTFISKLYQCRHIYRFCVNKRFLVKVSRTSLLKISTYFDFIRCLFYDVTEEFLPWFFLTLKSQIPNSKTECLLFCSSTKDRLVLFRASFLVFWHWKSK